MISVLTADDEILIKRTLKKLLEYEGSPFTVVGEAEDGGEALSLIEQLHPDLVITDIRMPVMDGLELIREASRLSPDTQFVILSGHDDFTYAQQALRYGAADYLLKPLKPDQFRVVLERILQKLEERIKSEVERRDLLWFCKSQAEPLAENLWLLNDAAVREQLEEINRVLSESEDDAAYRSHALDLMALVDGALAEKSGGSIRLDRDAMAGLPDRSDAVRQAVSDALAQAAEQIRQGRNWLSNQHLKRAAAYVRDNFAKETLTLQEVADVAGISASYFSRMFKEEFGTSFIHYVTKLRMEHARELLSEPDCKTYEVAYAIGYQDYPHFAKMFKKMYGVSPSDYRKRIGVEEA